jgi:hypothetical protein
MAKSMTAEGPLRGGDDAATRCAVWMFQSEMTSAPAVLAHRRSAQAGRRSFRIKAPFNCQNVARGRRYARCPPKHNWILGLDRKILITNLSANHCSVPISSEWSLRQAMGLGSADASDARSDRYHRPMDPDPFIWSNRARGRTGSGAVMTLRPAQPLSEIAIKPTLWTVDGCRFDSWRVKTEH